MDVALFESLQHHYDALCICTGTQDSKVIDLKGDKPLPAASIYKWYNDDDDVDRHSSLLDGDSLAIIGHGNVSIDIARMILKFHETIYPTDASASFLDCLKRSKIKKIHMIGRGSPANVSLEILIF